MLPLQNLQRTAAIALAAFFVSTAVCFAQAADSRVPAAPASAAGAAPAPVAHPFSSQEIVLAEVKGEVLVQSAGTADWIPAKKNQRLSPADIIKTGEKGAATITFDRKARVDLVPDTQITVEQASRSGSSRATVVNLDFGRLKADIQKLQGDSKFEVKTPTAVASVRGTTLFINTGATGEQKTTDLFVDNGLVHFFPLGNPDVGQLVDQFGLSSIFGDGSLLDLKHLSAQERKEFIDRFEAAFKNAGNPQGEVEESGEGEGDGGGDDGGDGGDADLSDIREDQSQRNLNFGDVDLGIKAAGLLLSEGLPNSGGFHFELVSQLSELGIVTEDRLSPLGSLLGATTQAEAAGAFNQLLQLRAAEREKMADAVRGVVSDLIDDQFFNFQQAQIEMVNDQQTGKVFTDVHGNRVRTDQYIFQPDQSSVNILSLTLRTGDYQPGITSVLFGVRFNQDIPEGMTFRDLPWNDYMNVVTREEMAEVLGIPSGYYDYESEEWVSNPDYDALPEQFIVHESNDLAGEHEFWPTQFYAEFQNPNADRLRFDDMFGVPMTIGEYLDSENYDGILSGFAGEEEREYDIQAIEEQTLLIAPNGGEQILVTQTHPELQPGDRWIQIGGGDQVTLYDEGDHGDDGAQSDDFVDEFNEDEAGNFATGDDLYDWATSSHHPAYFADSFDSRRDPENYENEIGRNALLGFFIPIDNDGNVLEGDEGQGGFAIDGLRDLFVPNQNVNGGNYNLEVIFAYGYVSEGEGGETFHEDFRFDAIITPELLSHHKFVNDSYLFPQSGAPYNNECQYQCY